MGQDFIFEIGCEELPSRQVISAMESLAAGFVRGCEASRISHGEVRAYSSPRRLALCVDDVSEFQQDLEVLRVGPAKSVSFDEAGELTKAASGFLRGLNVDSSRIETVVQERKKGVEIEYIAVRV